MRKPFPLPSGLSAPARTQALAAGGLFFPPWHREPPTKVFNSTPGFLPAGKNEQEVVRTGLQASTPVCALGAQAPALSAHPVSSQAVLVGRSGETHAQPPRLPRRPLLPPVGEHSLSTAGQLPSHLVLRDLLSGRLYLASRDSDILVTTGSTWGLAPSSTTPAWKERGPTR